MAISQKSLRHALMKFLQPLTQLIGKIGLPIKHRLMEERDAMQLVAISQPGDIMLSRKRWTMSNLVIPGFWKHAVIVVAPNQIVEAIGSGVRKTELYAWCLDHDYVMLLRPSFATAEQKLAAAALAETLIGIPYDDYIEFNPDSREPLKSAYCSEVIWWSYDQVFSFSGQANPIIGRPILGEETLEPVDFARARDKWDCEWVRDDND